MSIYSDLLFHHGHIANVALARSLATTEDAAPASGDAPPPAPDAAATRTDAAGQVQAHGCAAMPLAGRLSPFR